MQKWVSNIVVLLFLWTCHGLCAQNESQLLEKADSLYDKKKYAEAQQMYYQLFEKGYFTSASLLKMAFVYEGLDDIPKALFFLSQYYNKTGDAKAYDKIMVLSNAQNLKGYEISDLDRILMWVGKRSGFIVASLLLTALVTLILAFVGRSRRSGGMQISFGVLTCFVIILLGAVLNFGQPVQKGVISRPAYLMTGPSAGANLLTVIDGGNQVPILGTQDVWVKINWNEKVGYVKRSDLLSH